MQTFLNILETAIKKDKDKSSCYNLEISTKIKIIKGENDDCKDLKSRVTESPLNKDESHNHDSLLAVEGVHSTDNVPIDNITLQYLEQQAQVQEHKSGTETEKNQKTPFFKLVHELVTNRNKFEKKTYNNELYKLIANSGIGQMGRGLGGKSESDINLYKIPIPASDLSSPVYAG